MEKLTYKKVAGLCKEADSRRLLGMQNTYGEYTPRQQSQPVSWDPQPQPEPPYPSRQPAPGTARGIVVHQRMQPQQGFRSPQPRLIPPDPSRQPVPGMAPGAVGKLQEQAVNNSVRSMHSGEDAMRIQRGQFGATAVPAYVDENGVKHVVPKGERYNNVVARLDDIRNQAEKKLRRDMMDPAARVFSVEDTKNKPEYRRRFWGTNIGIPGTIDPLRAGQAYDDITSGKYNKTIFGLRIPGTRDLNKIDEENARRKNELWTRAVQKVKGNIGSLEDRTLDNDLMTSIYNTPVTPQTNYVKGPDGKLVELYQTPGRARAMYDKYGVPVQSHDSKLGGNLTVQELSELKNNMAVNFLNRLQSDAIGAAYDTGSNDWRNMRDLYTNMDTRGMGYADIARSRGFNMMLDNIRQHMMRNSQVDKSDIDNRMRLVRYMLLNSLAGKEDLT